MATFKEFFQNSKQKINIGVIGYSSQKFDEDVAKTHIKDAFDEIEKKYKKEIKDDVVFSVISGWSNVGIPKLAYEEAESRKWNTVGIACKKVDDYEKYPVKEGKKIGGDWGDESETFLNELTVLVKIGGGKQSTKEFEKAKEMKIEVKEYELDSKEDS